MVLSMISDGLLEVEEKRNNGSENPFTLHNRSMFTAESSLWTSCEASVGILSSPMCVMRVLVRVTLVDRQLDEGTPNAATCS